MNHIVIHGRLTRDPEFKTTQSGVNFCTFTVAVDRRYQSAENKQTDYFDCTAWRGAADTIHKYFAKGKEILVDGEMQSRKWVDTDGKNRVSWGVQVGNFDFCGSKNDSQSAPSQTAGMYTQPSSGAVMVEAEQDESDLPF